MKRPKHFDFLIDVLILASTSFGGPQVHFALFLERLVHKKKYLSEDDLLEIQALCSVLPGPTSTQIITAVGFRKGGPMLAYLTLLVWITPAVFIMTLAAYGMTYLRNKAILLYVLPVGIGMMLQASFSLAKKVITGPLYVLICLFTILIGLMYQTPYLFPVVLLIGGVISSFNYKVYPKQNKHKMIIPWANFYLFIGFFIFLALLGNFTDFFPIRLFENFYRNGSLVFGGGQVLAPVLFTEFVEFKHLINADDFLTGMALSQSLPGPIFALTSYLGVLLMRDYGLFGQLTGSAIGAAGIFLPGTFLIFFIYRIWGQLKQYRFIRASLAGIQAASLGLSFVAAYVFLSPMILTDNLIALLIVAISFLASQYTKLPSIVLFILALAIGIIIN
ncbi:chromate transporter [Aquirufa sp. ROCK2-A2]